MFGSFTLSLIIGVFAASIIYHDTKKITKHYVYTIDMISFLSFMFFIVNKIEFASFFDPNAFWPCTCLLIDVYLIPAIVISHFDYDK